MQHGEYFDHDIVEPIDDNIVGVGYGLSGAGFTARTIKLGVKGRLANDVEDQSAQSFGGGCIARRNICGDLFQLVDGFNRPDYPAHHDLLL